MSDWLHKWCTIVISFTLMVTVFIPTSAVEVACSLEDEAPLNSPSTCGDLNEEVASEAHFYGNEALEYLGTFMESGFSTVKSVAGFVRKHPLKVLTMFLALQNNNSQFKIPGAAGLTVTNAYQSLTYVPDGPAVPLLPMTITLSNSSSPIVNFMTNDNKGILSSSISGDLVSVGVGGWRMRGTLSSVNEMLSTLSFKPSTGYQSTIIINAEFRIPQNEYGTIIISPPSSDLVTTNLDQTILYDGSGNPVPLLPIRINSNLPDFALSIFCDENIGNFTSSVQNPSLRYVGADFLTKTGDRWYAQGNISSLNSVLANLFFKPTLSLYPQMIQIYPIISTPQVTFFTSPLSPATSSAAVLGIFRINPSVSTKTSTTSKTSSTRSTSATSITVTSSSTLLTTAPTQPQSNGGITSSSKDAISSSATQSPATISGVTITAQQSIITSSSISSLSGMEAKSSTKATASASSPKIPTVDTINGATVPSATTDSIDMKVISSAHPSVAPTYNKQSVADSTNAMSSQTLPTPSQISEGHYIEKSTDVILTAPIRDLPYEAIGGGLGGIILGMSVTAGLIYYVRKKHSSDQQHEVVLPVQQPTSDANKEDNQHHIPDQYTVLPLQSPINSLPMASARYDDIQAPQRNDGAQPQVPLRTLYSFLPEEKRYQTSLPNQGANPRDSFSTIHQAAEEGDCSLIDLFLGFSVSIDSRNKEGYTPLHLAAQAGKVDACKLLIERGANKNLRTKDEKTALVLAHEKGHNDLLNLLA